jgi:hypothetical protein
MKINGLEEEHGAVGLRITDNGGKSKGWPILLSDFAT